MLTHFYLHGLFESKKDLHVTFYLINFSDFVMGCSDQLLCAAIQIHVVYFVMGANCLIHLL